MSIAPPTAEVPAAQLAAFASLPAFALESTLERFMNDQELLCLAVTTCLQQTPEMLDALQAAVTDQDSGRCASRAHALKGAVGTCGGDRAAAAATQLERLAKGGDMAGAAALMPVLYAAFEAYRGEAAARLAL
ncbi:MAG TPA: Hpt domain-containing protein [Ramlibacter sp.]|nr:Hpt domain-containing protein [Ramlibacter sp.]